MIPSTLAAEVSGALRDFLSTGFGPSTPALPDVVKDFLDDSDNLLKGPYLSVDLPFQRELGKGAGDADLLAGGVGVDAARPEERGGSIVCTGSIQFQRNDEYLRLGSRVERVELRGTKSVRELSAPKSPPAPGGWRDVLLNEMNSSTRAGGTPRTYPAGQSRGCSACALRQPLG